MAARRLKRKLRMSRGRNLRGRERALEMHQKEREMHQKFRKVSFSDVEGRGK